jgi:hypothetical protein
MVIPRIGGIFLVGLHHDPASMLSFGLLETGGTVELLGVARHARGVSYEERYSRDREAQR